MSRPGDRVEVLDNREREVRDVVVDADGEVVQRLLLQQVVEDSFCHRRRELLRAKAAPAADADDRDLRVEERRRDVEVQRLAERAASFVRSRTAIFMTVFARVARKCFALHGGAGGPR